MIRIEKDNYKIRSDYVLSNGETVKKGRKEVIKALEDVLDYYGYIELHNDDIWFAYEDLLVIYAHLIKVRLKQRQKH